MNSAVAASPMPRVTLDQCPICGQASRRLFQKYEFWIRECRNCRHRFAELDTSPTHTDKVYGDDYFHGGGAGYPDYLGESRLLRQHGRRYAKILLKYMQPGTVLDVGAAAGFILQGLVDAGWCGKGIEPNASMAAYGRDRLGLNIQVGTLEQLDNQDVYDLIMMVQVVAHFYDLQQAFQAASAHTRSGGYWLIETWNYQSWMARILGTNWHEYSPPSVLHWFAPHDLRQLAAQHGFQQIAYGRPQKWLNGAHAKSLLQYKLSSSSLGRLLAKLLDLVPDTLDIPYPSEDLFWMLLQKQ